MPLQRGLDHPETLSADDRGRFVDVYRGGTDGIKRFRLRALAVLIAMYVPFLYLYLAIA